MYASHDADRYVCLSFNEANILLQNNQKLDHLSMIARLDNLFRHTSDPQLRNETESLLRKIQNLTPEEYKLLMRDVESGRIFFPPNYSLPNLG